MKKKSFLLPLLFIISLSGSAGDFVKTGDGIIVRPDIQFAGGARQVQLKVIANNIIRVMAIPDIDLKPLASLIITGKKESAKFDVIESKGNVSLKTTNLTAVVNLQTGAVSFFDLGGKQLHLVSFIIHQSILVLT